MQTEDSTSNQSEDRLVEVLLCGVFVELWHPILKLMLLVQPEQSIGVEISTCGRLAMMCPCLDMKFSS